MFKIVRIFLKLGNISTAGSSESNTVINAFDRMKITGHSCTKFRLTPPCSLKTEELKATNLNNKTIDKAPELCIILNKIFAESNLRDVMEIMKFSIASPLPLSLNRIAGFADKGSNDYQILFPNKVSLDFLQKWRLVIYLIILQKN